mmetsp:Transcript_38194/g.73242  ORF Transcript_38194/g.73242 Transcript_38194/m.73242 type:complete len:380 (+) Transcript_38194:233-1372(+)
MTCVNAMLQPCSSLVVSPSHTKRPFKLISSQIHSCLETRQQSNSHVPVFNKQRPSTHAYARRVLPELHVVAASSSDAALAAVRRWPPQDEGRVKQLRSRDDFAGKLEAAGDDLLVVGICTRYCGPCKAMHEHYVDISGEYKHVQFVHMMSDENLETREMAQSWRVSSTPAYHFYRNRKKVFSMLGAKPDTLRTHLDRISPRPCSTSSPTLEQQAPTAATPKAPSKVEPACATKPSWPPKEEDGPVRHIKSEEDAAAALAGSHDALTVIEVSMRYCGPCKFIYPTFLELSRELPSVKFYHVLGDGSVATRNLLSKWRVAATPSFHFFRNGKKVFSLMGAKPTVLRHHVHRMSDLQKTIKPSVKKVPMHHSDVQQDQPQHG